MEFNPFGFGPFAPRTEPLKRDPEEPILSDDYPVYPDYWYVVDGKPRRSPIGGDVRGLKIALDANEIRRCDMVARHM